MLNKHFKIDSRYTIQEKRAIEDDKPGITYVLQLSGVKSLYVPKEYFDAVKAGDTLLTIIIPESEVYGDI